MNNARTPLRPAMTAVAAFIAQSSTSLMAQTADAVDAPTAPDVATTSQAAVPQIDVPAPAAIAPVAATPVMRTVGTPVEHVEDAPAATAAPAHVVRAAPVAAAVKPLPRVDAVPSKLAVTTASAAPADVSTPAAKLSSAPVQAAAQPVAVQSSVTRYEGNDVLPVAGAIGLGILAIGGAAVAFGRRRREDDEVIADASTETSLDPMVDAPAVPQPTMARVPAPTLAATTGSNRLPSGFDLSRYGRHVQAAYRGPTADNPSHSLRRRLKHARFFDQREREGIATAATEQPMREPVYATRAATAPQDGQITIRMAPQRLQNRFGTVLQK